MEETCLVYTSLASTNGLRKFRVDSDKYYNIRESLSEERLSNFKKLTRLHVPTLFEACIEFITLHIDCLESLEGFPSQIGQLIWNKAVEFNLLVNEYSINIFTSAYPNSIANSVNLSKSLRLINEMDRVIFALLCHEGLKALDISGCDLGDNHELFKYMWKMKSLKILNISLNNLSRNGLRVITLPRKMTCKPLEYVDLSGNPKLTEADYRRYLVDIADIIVTDQGLSTDCGQVLKRLGFTYRHRADIREIKNDGWHIPFFAKQRESLKHELSDAKDYINGVIMGTDLPMAKCIDKEPATFVAEKYTDKRYQVLCGVVIENFSKYILTKPIISNYSKYYERHCASARIVHAPSTSIYPGEVGIYVVDNGIKSGKDVCGSISWQILRPDGVSNVTRKNKIGKLFNVRLKIEFNVNFRGSCGKISGRLNHYQANFHPFFRFNGGHRSHFAYSYSIQRYSNQFLTETEMEFGCSPILRLRLFPIAKHSETLLWTAETEKKYDSSRSTEFSLSNNEYYQLWNYFCYGIFSLCGAVLLIATIIAFIKVERNRLKRRALSI